MKIYEGSTRLVLAFPSLHIVFKIPFARFSCGPDFDRLMGVPDDQQVFPKWTRWTMFKFWLKYLWFGLQANWGELTFYRKHRQPFLVRTYFSLLGLCNVQKYGTPVKMSKEAFWRELERVTQQRWRKSHSFLNPANFCEEDGRLKMVDYGEQEAKTRIGLGLGETIYKNFRLPNS